MNYTYNSQEAINETSTTLFPQIYITATKNNHTTSTKCQYHAAASKPKWWFFEKCVFKCLIKQTIIKHVPTKTWNPWNPVAMKNVEPYILSDIVNSASTYSNNWSEINNNAKTIVYIKAKIVSK